MRDKVLRGAVAAVFVPSAAAAILFANAWRLYGHARRVTRRVARRTYRRGYYGKAYYGARSHYGAPRYGCRCY